MCQDKLMTKTGPVINFIIYRRVGLYICKVKNGAASPPFIFSMVFN